MKSLLITTLVLLALAMPVLALWKSPESSQPASDVGVEYLSFFESQKGVSE